MALQAEITTRRDVCPTLYRRCPPKCVGLLRGAPVILITFHAVALRAAVGIGRRTVALDAVRDHRRPGWRNLAAPFCSFVPDRPFLRPRILPATGSDPTRLPPKPHRHHRGKHDDPSIDTTLSSGHGFHCFAPELHRIYFILRAASLLAALQNPVTSLSYTGVSSLTAMMHPE